MQADFAREILSRLKKQGIHTAIDTSGFAPRRELDKVIPYTDLFLYDLKAYSEECHLRYTGQSNAQILDNLYYLDSLGKRIEIRVPFVPECNSQEMEGIASVIARLRHVSTVRLLPYHSYAASKYEALGIKNTLPTRLPTEEELRDTRELIHSITGLRVI